MPLAETLKSRIWWLRLFWKLSWKSLRLHKVVMSSLAEPCVLCCTTLTVPKREPFSSGSICWFLCPPQGSHAATLPLLKASLSKVGKCQKQMPSPHQIHKPSLSLFIADIKDSQYVFAVIFFKQYMNIRLRDFKFLIDTRPTIYNYVLRIFITTIIPISPLSFLLPIIM